MTFLRQRFREWIRDAEQMYQYALSICSEARAPCVAIILAARPGIRTDQQRLQVMEYLITPFLLAPSIDTIARQRWVWPYQNRTSFLPGHIAMDKIAPVPRLKAISLGSFSSPSFP
jgi:hypothetical protein